MGLPSLAQIRDERCRRDALYWAQNWTKTENPHYLQQGLPYDGPFPTKTYFIPLFKALREQRRIFIPKTREMITSWSVMVHAVHQAQWYKAEVIVQTDSEGKAKKLLHYADCLYRNQPEFLRKLHPLERDATDLTISFLGGGSVSGIPSGEHKIRMYHPTIYIMDEAAFLPEAEACYNAAAPVARQIIAISSAGPGWFADQCQR